MGESNTESEREKKIKQCTGKKHETGKLFQMRSKGMKKNTDNLLNIYGLYLSFMLLKLEAKVPNVKGRKKRVEERRRQRERERESDG